MKIDPNLFRELAGMVPEEGWHELCHDAADEIERLRAENTQYLEDAVETAKMVAEQRDEIARLRAAIRKAQIWMLLPEQIDLSGSDAVYNALDEVYTYEQSADTETK